VDTLNADIKEHRMIKLQYMYALVYNRLYLIRISLISSYKETAEGIYLIHLA
jgi:hypothetical protein